MECLQEAGHSCWVYVHPKPNIAPMYREMFPTLQILNTTFWQKMLSGNLYKKAKSPKYYDLIIHYSPRKSYQEVPVFEGNHIVWIMSEDAGFQSYFYEKIKVEKVFFFSNWERRHYLERENYDNPTNSIGISVDEAWAIPRSWDRNRFSVQYPPISDRHFDRFIRTSLRSSGQLIRTNKVHTDWFTEWYPFLSKDLPKTIPFSIKMGRITSHNEKREFWSRRDAVVWVSSTKENFGLNLHEAIFSGCVPLVLEKNDASTELLKCFEMGFTFKNKTELIGHIELLKQQPSTVIHHSEKALEATDQLRYENFYPIFMNKLKGIV